MDPASLAGAHLLLLDDEVEPSDVLVLLTTRQPGATLGEDGTWRLSRHSSLIGPVSLSPEDADALGLSALPGGPVQSVFVLETPLEREDGPPPEWYRDRNGLHLAYPAGLPHREEGRFLELLIDIARRLHLSVRLSDAPAGPAPDPSSARFVTPDPDDAVNLQVYSGYWLTPETLLPVVQRVAPGAELAIEGAEWHGPPPGLVDSPEEGGADADLTITERVALHARADQFDAEALDAEQVLDGYGIVIDLTRDPEAVTHDEGAPQAAGNPPTGVIELRMHVAEEIPPALANTDWGAFDVVEYEIRWMDDGEERYQRDPSPEFRAARAAARPVIEALARVVVEAVSGEILDEFGFLVDRYQL